MGGAGGVSVACLDHHVYTFHHQILVLCDLGRVRVKTRGVRVRVRLGGIRIGVAAPSCDKLSESVAHQYEVRSGLKGCRVLHHNFS